MTTNLFRLFTVFALITLLLSPASAMAYAGREAPLNQNQVLVDWFENFDGYATDLNLHGVGGWTGWNNDPNATAYTRDEQARSAPNSVEIAGASDLVHLYSETDGLWVYTAWQYIPSSTTGQTYFILLNQYDGGGANTNWSTQVMFDTGIDQVVNTGISAGTDTIIYDQWVEIRVVIDLDANTQEFFYGGDSLYAGTWTEEVSGGGITTIATVDLFANSATAVYYDDLSLVEVLPFNVSLEPETSTVIGAPGETITHTFTLTNIGTSADTYDLAVSGNTWPTTVDDNTGVVQPGESIDVHVLVNIPADPGPEVIIGSDTFTLTATSQGDPTVSAQATGTTLAEATPGVDLGADQAGEGGVGATVDYIFTVTNLGNFTDTFALDLAGGMFTSTLSVTSTGVLAPGASEDVTLMVEIPADAMIGAMDAVTLTATSMLDPMVVDSALATTTVIPTPGVDLGVDQEGSGLPGAQVEYTFQVTNLGDYTDTFNLELVPGTFTYTLSATQTGALAPGASENVTLLVDIPLEAAAGVTDTATLSAISMLDPAVMDSATATTLVEAEPLLLGVDLSDDQMGEGVTGTVVTYHFWVTNTGELTDTYLLELSGAVWTATLSVTNTGLLGPGEATQVLVMVEIPVDATLGMTDTVTLTAISMLDPTVTDSAMATTTVVAEIPKPYRAYLPLIMRNYLAAP